MLVEASSLRNKKRFLEKLKGKGEGEDPQAQAAAATQERMAQLETDILQAKVDLAQAQTRKTEAEAVVKMVEAPYTAMQAANVAVSSAPTVPVADAILLSAGYKDQNQPPVIPEVAGAAVAQPAQLPGVARNTSPMFPAQPQGPGVGMMRGIETARNDGAKPAPIG
jgi:hypothetical protein